MRSLACLLVSTVVALVVTVVLFTVVPTMVGVHRGEDWRNLAPWIPGLGVAMMSGAVGAFFGGMLQIWLHAAGSENNEWHGVQVSGLDYGLRPVLGATAGVVIFLLYAATKLRKFQAATLGEIPWLLRPYTTQALALYSLFAISTGFFFPLLADVFTRTCTRV